MVFSRQQLLMQLTVAFDGQWSDAVAMGNGLFLAHFQLNTFGGG
jgi:hypothetical protein